MVGPSDYRQTGPIWVGGGTARRTASDTDRDMSNDYVYECSRDGCERRVLVKANRHEDIERVTCGCGEFARMDLVRVYGRGGGGPYDGEADADTDTRLDPDDDRAPTDVVLDRLDDVGYATTRLRVKDYLLGNIDKDDLSTREWQLAIKLANGVGIFGTRNSRRDPPSWVLYCPDGETFKIRYLGTDSPTTMVGTESVTGVIGGWLNDPDVSLKFVPVDEDGLGREMPDHA